MIVCLVLGAGAYFLSRSWFTNENEIAVGEEATVDDYFAEAGWEPVSTNTETSLSSVDFADMNTGWTVGIDGLILNSDDGGASWQEQSSGTEVDLNADWVVVEKGTILRTIDGGDTWDVLDSTTHRSLHAVHFIEASTGWVVGGGGLYGSDPELTADNQVILRTDDGGDTWKRQEGTSNKATCNRGPGW